MGAIHTSADIERRIVEIDREKTEAVEDRERFTRLDSEQIHARALLGVVRDREAETARKAREVHLAGLAKKLDREEKRVQAAREARRKPILEEYAATVARLLALRQVAAAELAATADEEGPLDEMRRELDRRTPYVPSLGRQIAGAAHEACDAALRASQRWVKQGESGYLESDPDHDYLRGLRDAFAEAARRSFR